MEYGFCRTDIENAINKTYKANKRRKVIYDRMINRLTYDELIKKYYVSDGFTTHKQKRHYYALINNMVYKVKRELISSKKQKGVIN